MLLPCWSRAPLAQYGAPIPPSALPGSDTSVARPGSVCGIHRSLCWILNGCHQFGIPVAAAHDVRSEIEVPPLPLDLPSCVSRRFVAACVTAVPAAAPRTCWSESLDLAVSSPIQGWSSILASPIHPRITGSIFLINWLHDCVLHSCSAVFHARHCCNLVLSPGVSLVSRVRRLRAPQKRTGAQPGEVFSCGSEIGTEAVCEPDRNTQ